MRSSTNVERRRHEQKTVAAETLALAGVKLIYGIAHHSLMGLTLHMVKAVIKCPRSLAR
jgi:hypothetical protein